MIIIDGSQGEGGGQMVRTALALSALTGIPFRITGIRKNRPEPGLKAQHLHAVKAVMKVCGAKVEGAALGSQELVFSPGKLAAKRIEVDVGTAGSLTLLLQSLLLPAMFAGKTSRFTLIGGTNVAWSMPVEYLQEVGVPPFRRYVEKLDVVGKKRGYYPKGGGCIEVRVRPKWFVEGSFSGFLEKFRAEAPGIDLTGRAHLMLVKGVSHASEDLQDAHVAERAAQAARQTLRGLKCPVEIHHEYAKTASIGSGVTLWAVFSRKDDEIDVLNPIRIGADALGEKGTRAEDVGREAAMRLLEEINSGTLVDRHLADNVVPLMGLLGRSVIQTSAITDHTRTNMSVVECFLPVKFTSEGNTIRSN